jgi:lysophospholipase L1-like esterase
VPAAPPAYVALGDSFSSGLGAKPYRSGACLRSRRAYPYLLGRPVTSFRACAAATTDDVLRHQLRPFPPRTRLVTITIGGNDVGFVDIVATCLLGTSRGCERRAGRAEQFIRRELPARLRRVYDRIRERAPHATVVVAGYPRLFARGPWCGSIGSISDREQRLLNAGSDLLARTIAAEVRHHRGFRFADVRAAFDGHAACSTAPRINTGGIGAFHPSARGYASYARVIRARL